LEALGYYHSKITSQLISKPNAYTAIYNVQLGKPSVIQSVKIEVHGPGQKNPELLKLINQPTLSKGMQLIHAAYEDYKEELLGKALQMGYLEAAFTTNEIQLHPDKYKADILLILDTGPQYYFGSVTFSESPYPNDFLQRYVPFKLGTPYTTEELLALQKSLTESDLFTRVRIYPQLEEAENYQVPLKVRLKKRPNYKYTTSIGFGTDTGPRGLVGFERRLINYPGHRIDGDIQASKRRNQANLQYTILGLNPTTDRLVFGVQGIEERIVAENYSRRIDTRILKISKVGSWQRIFGIHYLTEVFHQIKGTPNKVSRFLMPTGSLLWTNIKQSSFRVHGTRFGITIRGGLKPLLSTTNLFQIETKAKWILPIGENARLLLRGDVGATFSSNQKAVPPSLRFFTGGDHTVRGYGYKTLGPLEKSPSGKLVEVGGRYLLVGSIELERRIYKEFSGAIFTDAGNAMNHWNQKLAYSAGFGIRWGTPLGPLRLDIAKPLKKRNGKARPRIHLTFGLDL